MQGQNKAVRSTQGGGGVSPSPLAYFYIKKIKWQSVACTCTIILANVSLWYFLVFDLAKSLLKFINVEMTPKKRERSERVKSLDLFDCVCHVCCVSWKWCHLTIIWGWHPPFWYAVFRGCLDGKQYAKGRYAVRKNPVISYADVYFYF